MKFSFTDKNGTRVSVHNIDTAIETASAADYTEPAQAEYYKDALKKLCDGKVKDQLFTVRINGKKYRVKYFLVNNMEMPRTTRDQIKTLITQSVRERSIEIRSAGETITGYWVVI